MTKKSDKKRKLKKPVRGNPDNWKMLPGDTSIDEVVDSFFDDKENINEEILSDLQEKSYENLEKERKQEIAENPATSFDEAKERQEKYNEKRKEIKKKYSKGRSKKQRSDIAAIIRVCYSMEQSPEDIIEIVQNEYDITLSTADVAQYIARVEREIKSDIESKDAGIVYSRYIMGQISIMRDLNKVINKTINNGKYANATVGALRLKMDINDKILKTGQEMGFVAKIPEGHYVIDGKDLRNLTTDEIINKIADEDEQTRELVKQIAKSTGLTKKKIEGGGKVFFLTPESRQKHTKQTRKEMKEAATEE